MIGLVLPSGVSELFQLFFIHGISYFPRWAFEFALRRITALGGKSGSGRFLLGL